MNRRQFILAVPAVAAVSGLVQPAPPSGVFSGGLFAYIDKNANLPGPTPDWEAFQSMLEPFFVDGVQRYPLTTRTRPR